MSVEAGDVAPDFRLPSTEGEVSLAGALRGGRRLVLAFYFEDGTPSCAAELSMLRDSHELIAELTGAVIAVSADSIESHRALAERDGAFPFPLASDPALDAARAYGVIDEADPRRARRAVFVVNSDGSVLLAIPHFQPSNVDQVEAIFRALGMEG